MQPFHPLVRSLAAMLLVLSAVSSLPGAQPPTTEARKLTGKIVIDGKLDEADWAAGAWTTGFRRLRTQAEGDGRALADDVETRFKVLYDDGALYVAVVSQEPHLDKLKAETTSHDGAVWTDDCVELFFDPENTGRYYHHIMVNSKGVVHDAYATDFGVALSRLWNCAFETATSVDREAGRWTVEMRIPFASIRLGQKPGKTWLLNVARERHTTGRLQLYTWSPIEKGGFHQPKLFGSLKGIDVDFTPFRFDSTEPNVSVARAASGVTTLHMSTALANQSGADRTLVGKAWLLNDPAVAVVSKPMTAPAGAVTTVEFPVMQMRRAATRSQVVFSFESPDGQTVYHRLVKDLSLEYRPVVVEVIRPVYRNTIYATQKLDTLTFRIALSLDMLQQGRRVNYTLSTADGKTLVDGGQLPIDQLDRNIGINVKDLPVGTYRLEAEVYDDGGKRLNAGSQTVQKLPAPAAGTEVRIDEHRNVLIDGRPFFALGWYGGVPTNDPREDVVALQNFSTPTVVTMYPKPDLHTMREDYRRYGIRRIVSIEPRRLFHGFGLWRADRREIGEKVRNEILTDKQPSPETAALLKELVQTVRGEPWLVGYYIADEPDIQNFRSDYLENLYALMTELDPYHPVMVTNYSVDGIVTHGYKCADILAPDPYKRDFDYLPNFMKKALEVGRRGKATYVTLWHSASDTHFTKPYGSDRAYPYEFVRHQYLASMAYGCKGYAAYISSFFFPEPEYYIGLPYVWREMLFLKDAMMAPAPADPVAVKSTAEMASWIRRLDGKVYLVVVNHKPGARNAEVSHPLLKDVGELIVMSEDRKIALAEGGFTDRFEEGAARIYTTDAAGAGFPSTTKVRAAIDEFKRRIAKPGNLLHLSQGVFLRADKGFYAPWFHQYYFYACNGITFDKGWTVHQWDGKSSWLEILMKDKAPVKRLVVYTPNISDYTIELHDGDRWTTAVTQKGNDKEKVEHVLEEAVEAIKLRITVTGTRDGNPTLSEIEAYSK